MHHSADMYYNAPVLPCTSSVGFSKSCTLSDWKYNQRFYCILLGEENPNTASAQSVGIDDSMGWFSISMGVALYINILMAVLLGTLAGLGVGGGSILLLWLTLVEKIPIEQARIYNLLFFLPTASIVGFHAVKSSRIRVKEILPAVIGGCIAAVLCSKLQTFLPIKILKRLFGIILLFTGIREIRYRPRNAK